MQKRHQNGCTHQIRIWERIHLSLEELYRTLTRASLFRETLQLPSLLHRGPRKPLQLLSLLGRGPRKPLQLLSFLNPGRKIVEKGIRLP